MEREFSTNQFRIEGDRGVAIMPKMIDVEQIRNLGKTIESAQAHAWPAGRGGRQLREIALDFSDTDQVNTSAWGMLILLQDELARENIRLTIHRQTSRVATPIRLLGIGKPRVHEIAFWQRNGIVRLMSNRVFLILTTLGFGMAVLLRLVAR